MLTEDVGYFCDIISSELFLCTLIYTRLWDLCKIPGLVKRVYTTFDFFNTLRHLLILHLLSTYPSSLVVLELFEQQLYLEPIL